MLNKSIKMKRKNKRRQLLLIQICITLQYSALSILAPSSNVLKKQTLCTKELHTKMHFEFVRKCHFCLLKGGSFLPRAF